MGFLMPPEGAASWRGPMVMSAVQTLTRKVAWAPLDILVLDMPPGTGTFPSSFRSPQNPRMNPVQCLTALPVGQRSLRLGLAQHAIVRQDSGGSQSSVQVMAGA